jgi:hypothetical protein
VPERPRPTLRNVRRVLPALVAAALCGSCGATGKETAAPTRKQGQCTFQERQAAVCAQLERAVLTELDGAPAGLGLADCRVAALTAELAWRASSDAKRLYRARLEFRSEGLQGPLTPTQFDPVIWQWPCQDDCWDSDLRVRLPVADQCRAPARPTTTVEFVVPRTGPTSCAGQAKLTGGDPSWCQRAVSAESARYTVRWAEPHTYRVDHEVVLDVDPNQATAAVDGQPPVPIELGALREQLPYVWDFPSIVDESCRAEAAEVIEAKRPGRWKAVLRSCGSVVDLTAVRGLVRPGTTEARGR